MRSTIAELWRSPAPLLCGERCSRGLACAGSFIDGSFDSATYKREATMLDRALRVKCQCVCCRRITTQFSYDEEDRGRLKYWYCGCYTSGQLSKQEEKAT